MASVPPGIQLGSPPASHRAPLLEQELAHHSAVGVYSICSYSPSFKLFSKFDPRTRGQSESAAPTGRYVTPAPGKVEKSVSRRGCQVSGLAF